MRPAALDEIVGQKHIVGEGKLLQRMIKSNRLSSIILYGPPGTGKTTIANVIAQLTSLPYYEINAVSSGKKEMEAVVQEAKLLGKSILFVDEVHRFNKSQQDFLLPYMESGLIILIGATTENPHFEINNAIKSRCTVLELTHPQPDEIKEVLQRALHDERKGFGKLNIELEDGVLDELALHCGGDIRAALNGLEIAVLSTDPNDDEQILITLDIIKECLQKKSLHYDKKGDHFYNIISAFQKSMRGSDVDGALHYLARLIEAGDLDVICRRLLVTAWEDIGLANSHVPQMVLSAIQSAERLGLPEARIPLSVAVTELCLSPKSNSAYKALDHALNDVRSANIGEVPDHLKDAHYRGAKELGRGVDYKYPHDFGGWVKQQYLPDHLKDKKYYKPKESGQEKRLAQFHNRIQELKKS
ncbi:replication-associated recombination protein A [Alkalihalobacterium chitinilyticum]|uniref:Replication-associated recombination protein A n=1 Tax=Alkalihalobacterium chitinilyticum TaxID=2980103 RepID=A0ABT5VE42_9BACI|nr:replication-associated recombination protein A [Alkalihalobacterium chitinilyticum]MDE5413726.1 replication-associated recombination protein A [Alkalihalobacterium chitinilyticum]